MGIKGLCQKDQSQPPPSPSFHLPTNPGCPLALSGQQAGPPTCSAPPACFLIPETSQLPLPGTPTSHYKPSPPVQPPPILMCTTTCARPISTLCYNLGPPKLLASKDQPPQPIPLANSNEVPVMIEVRLKTNPRNQVPVMIEVRLPPSLPPQPSLPTFSGGLATDQATSLDLQPRQPRPASANLLA
ncbi:hypothetical protein PCANC_11307 [Puccinia coronata f. sp. avenae]|uniref:Uncharacterized protein n=1 Tax=Puccinia coronata f. sp. avenae TaxID=200324 RepID=A0A2N5V5C4_9BASI|nr:hypothetical protein PCASD_09360 [Puccinia coronata f. sp. avenae]PLW45180.1 hypothetical protein PCANC_11307 [Puccinia coronata f. sp. avenae]